MADQIDLSVPPLIRLRKCESHSVAEGLGNGSTWGCLILYWGVLVPEPCGRIFVASGIHATSPRLKTSTKSDKLSRTELKKQISKIESAFFGDSPQEMIVYSSKNHKGRKELWDRILILAGNKSRSPGKAGIGLNTTLIES